MYGHEVVVTGIDQGRGGEVDRTFSVTIPTEDANLIRGLIKGDKRGKGFVQKLQLPAFSEGVKPAESMVVTIGLTNRDVDIIGEVLTGECNVGVIGVCLDLFDRFAAAGGQVNEGLRERVQTRLMNQQLGAEQLQ